MKWGLGTVQFGTNYGVSNQRGQTSLQDAGLILRQAYEAGIRLLDTAPGYGNSEEVLGSYLPKFPEFRVMTKTVAWNDTDPGQLESHFQKGLETSLRRLGRSRADVVLLHQPSLLNNFGSFVTKALQSLKTAGLTHSIGISIYNGSEIDYCLSLFSNRMSFKYRLIYLISDC